MPPIVNIAAYKFATLTGLAPLRDELRELCKAGHIRGNILLSPEGINIFAAGARDSIDALLLRVKQIPGLQQLEVKESYSNDRPFSRMLVKIKREIIAFGVDGIDPRRYASRRLSAGDLKQWLDEGRPVTLLDTRNNFEFQTGTFKNAIAANIEDFRDFPSAVDQLPDDLKQQPIVTFCTGGIRCEKAAPFLERAGFTDVYQLDGGILTYFETCGSAHYQGQCFVFDKRVALDADLQIGGLQQCFACQAILSADDQQSPKYVAGQSCPHCHKTDEVANEELLENRRAAIQRVTAVLPGSMPYENIRPISVPQRLDGLELLDFLDAMRTHLPRDQWGQAAEEGRLICRGERALPGRIMRGGDRILHSMPATLEPAVSSAIEIMYEDDALVAINKPAPLPMHPCGRFNRNSLSYILDQVYQPVYLRPAHRLDADTSGIVLFTKTREAARHLQNQFESRTVTKTYIARVHGRPTQSKFECHDPITADTKAGAIRLPDEHGQPASTRFELLRADDDGTSLLRAEPLTGRTNQIRVHAWALELPIVGDPIYQRAGQLGSGQALSMTDPPLCLHAFAIEIQHPISHQPLRFEAPLPGWANGAFMV